MNSKAERQTKLKLEHIIFVSSCFLSGSNTIFYEVASALDLFVREFFRLLRLACVENKGTF